MTLPTQSELATLAASIQIPNDQSIGDEIEFRANRAFDLWRICGGLLEGAPAMVAAMVAKADERREFYSKIKVPLDEFLKAARPGESLTDSKIKWKAYRKRNFAPEDLDRIGARNKSDRTEGLHVEGLHVVARDFLSFIEREAAKAKKTRGRKGAIARHGLPKEIMERLEKDHPGQWAKSAKPIE